MRAAVTSALELAGMAAITIGAAMAWLPAGFMVGGAAMVVAGVAEGRKS